MKMKSFIADCMECIFLIGKSFIADCMECIFLTDEGFMVTNRF